MYKLHKAFIIGMFIVAAASLEVFSADDLTTWPWSKSIAFTPSLGSPVWQSTAETNFPVLIRLTSANAAAVFSGANSNGDDLRFSKSDGTQLQYELVKYSQANQQAFAWVRMDTLFTNPASPQKIKMYWGKSGAARGSDSSQVFGSAYGFGAVLHLNTTARADSSNGMHLFADATGQAPRVWSNGQVSDTDGVFDRARYMHCSGAASSGMAGDSIIIPGMLGSPQQVTMSAWVRVDSVDQANSAKTSNIFSIASSVGWRDSSTAGTGNDFLQAGGNFSGANNSLQWPRYPTGSSGQALSKKVWKHVVGVINGAASPNAYIKFYVNGDSVQFSQPATQGTITYPANSGVNTVIGRHSGGSPQAGKKFGGSIMEARVDKLLRSSDWIKLSYRNQQVNDSITSIDNTPPTPVLSAPSNGSTDQSLTLSLSWTTAWGATSYVVQVASASTFGSANVFESSGAETGVSASGPLLRNDVLLASGGHQRLRHRRLVEQLELHDLFRGRPAGSAGCRFTRERRD